VALYAIDDSSVRTATATLDPHPILDAPVASPRHAAEESLPIAEESLPIAEPGWPCTTCGASVPLDLTACPACGAGFLDGARSSVSLVVPGVGDVAKLGKGAKLAVIAGGASAVTLVLFLVYLVLGALV
jgi:hypothetical protein